MQSVGKARDVKELVVVRRIGNEIEKREVLFPMSNGESLEQKEKNSIPALALSVLSSLNCCCCCCCLKPAQGMERQENKTM